MRKIAALLASAAATLATAGVAHADVSNPITGGWDTPTQSWRSCTTPGSLGAPFAYGGWGDYIDGCTVRLTCPRSNGRACGVSMNAYIVSNVGSTGRRGKVTQNARLTMYGPLASSPVTWQDKSCAGDNGFCQNFHSTTIKPGQTGAVQCNGVREHFAGAATVGNTCEVSLYP
jgi:hypothetical protein